MSSNSSIEKQLTLWFGYFPSRLMLSSFSVEKIGNFVLGVSVVITSNFQC